MASSDGGENYFENGCDALLFCNLACLDAVVRRPFALVGDDAWVCGGHPLIADFVFELVLHATVRDAPLDSVYIDDN